MEHDAVHVAQDLERCCFERRLADALAERVRVVAVDAVGGRFAAFELVDDEGRQETRGVFAATEGTDKIFIGEDV